MLDSVDTVEDVLDGLGNVVFHLFRSGSRVRGDDHDPIDLHIGQEIYRQACQGKKAQDDHPDEDHDRGDRATYG